MVGFLLISLLHTKRLGFSFIRRPSSRVSGPETSSIRFIHPNPPSSPAPQGSRNSPLLRLAAHRSDPQQIQLRRRPPLPVIPAICMPSSNLCSICSRICKISTQKWPQTGLAAAWGERGDPQALPPPIHSLRRATGSTLCLGDLFTFRQFWCCL